jgi:IS30 family transposase
MGYLPVDSATATRFLASVREGNSLKRSARAAGVHPSTGYRWLGQRYGELREQGLSPQAAQDALGCWSSKAAAWESQWLARRETGRRHHRRAPAADEQAFWEAFDAGAGLGQAHRTAGIARSTAYRWLQRRFAGLREQGLSVPAAARKLRVALSLARRWEDDRRRAVERKRREREAADRAVVRTSARYAEQLLRPRATNSKIVERDTRYWQLMRSGLNNTAACKVLGVSRHTGGLIRARHHRQTPSAVRPAGSSGRYLSLHERCQIADLPRLDYSMRTIAAELGRSPSTIKRELDRHRDGQGRYLPHTADHAAVEQRRRPRDPRLIVHPRLRKLVQRKLNRCWSPDEISAWLKNAYPDDQRMRLCPETIYRALLTPGGRGLHKRYCAKLRTGRRIRKSRWLSDTRHGSVVRDMTMIDQRPTEVEEKKQPGHWEGDLIVGVGSASAMMTLRERVTHYGIVVNLPADHTAESVNAAAVAAFAPLPAHMKRTLTWDQGVEMARHRDLAKATGIDIYFAERCSPWQRGANENYNGLLRQYFPKGTDLSVHSDGRIAAVMQELNTRPRKRLSYDTPAARFRAASRRGPRDTPMPLVGASTT